MKRSRAYIALVSGLSVAACASVPRPFPDLDDSTLQDAVAVVRFRGGTYLEQFSECRGEDVICLNPPPFELRAEVVQQLFGPPLPRTIAVASTSHHGIPRNSPNELQLVHLVTDGTSIVMPRYHWKRVGEDTNGDLVVPAYPEEVWFLPCETNSAAKPVRFRLPRDRFSRPRDDFEEQTLRTNGDFFLINDHVVRPRLGIPIDSLAELLREASPQEVPISVVANSKIVSRALCQPPNKQLQRDGSNGIAARRACVISLCTCAALHTAARRR